ncbi:MAG: FAD-binding oxidoreductase [Pseudomonadota bacterium]
MTQTKVDETTLGLLKGIVGEAGYLDRPDDMAPYCASWRDDWVGQVPLVLRPANTQQVAAIVETCAAAGVAIVPQGGNTGLTGASQPHDTGNEVVVSLNRMTTIRALDADDATITVDAGVVLHDVQRAASEAGFLFPLSLGAEGSCRIGGNLSTNAGGVQVLRYGNARALTLGLEVVLPDGRIWDGLRVLAKDNTGYDLKQMFIGGEGTLGIITGAVLRLHPRPTARETAFAAVSDPRAGLAVLRLLREQMGDALSACELMRRAIIDFLLEHVPGHSDPLADPLAQPHPWYMLIEVSGQGAPDHLRAGLEDALARAMEQGLITDAVMATSQGQAARFWKMREDLAEAQKRAGVGIKHDVSVPVSQVPTFLAQADAALDAAYPGIRHCSFGHLGDGNIHYNPVAPPNWDGARFKAETTAINRIVHDIVAKLNGSISAEHGIGRLRLSENEHYKSAVELDMMRSIKRALDPANIMNPGKTIRV